MKFYIVCFSIVMLLGCRDHVKAPDVSNIEVRLKVERFEKDFFAIDSNHIKEGLSAVEKKYPDFLPLYINHVLGLGPLSDTNELAYIGTKRFLYLNRKPFEKARSIYKDFDDVQDELTTAFKYCKYYFPEYPIPTIITTVGPMDALAPMSNYEPTPNFIGKDFLAIGLQFYLGKDFEIYNDPDYISQIAPAYRSRRFTKEYMVTDIMKLVVDDLYPDSSSRLPFAEQMVERGKRMMLLKKLLPQTHDSIIFGYTGEQLKWALTNERSTYNFLVQSGLLYERDPILVRPYLSDGPFTRSLGETSPGNIGTFMGWRIVEAYLKQHNKEADLAELMRTSPQKIMNESKYKPG